MQKIAGWSAALVTLVAAVAAIAFWRPAWLPPPVHAQLMKLNLASPLPAPAAAQGAPGAAAPAGQPGGQAARPPGQVGPPQPGGAPQGAAGGPPAGGPQAGGPPGGGPRPVAVEATKPKIDRISTSLLAVGTLRADETVVVSAEIEGRIAAIEFREGAPVAEGAVLFRLDDEILKAELGQAKSELVLAEANFERADTLFRQKSGTERARDETRFSLDRARANVALASARLDKATVRAPFAGVVGLRAVSAGEFITRGETVVTLSRVDPIKVDFRLPETDLAEIAVGARILVEVDALPGRRFEGSVFAIDPQVDVNGRAIQLRARLANKDGVLKPGLFARVELVTAERKDAILIPEAAILTQGRDRVVFVVRDGKAARVVVVPGLRRPGEIEIREGLKPDDTVIVTGQQRVRDGAPVEVVGRGPAS